MKNKPISKIIFAIVFPIALLTGSFVRGQIIMTVAGTGARGYFGDMGAATACGLNQPWQIRNDGAGSIIFTDNANNVVRKIDASGVITTIAGGGYSGLGDGGPATVANLNQPIGLFVDVVGNIFISDFGNNRVRKIDGLGIITTVAGNGTPGFGGDGAAATLASLHRPTGIWMDGAGNLYIADYFNARIRKVGPTGTISTIAGNGFVGSSGDGGPAVLAELHDPYSVTIDGPGNIYIADGHDNLVRKIDPSGTIRTVAGGGSVLGDGGPATAAFINVSIDVLTDTYGNLYISDGNGSRIRKVDPTGVITTIAGTGAATYGGDGGAATAAEISHPGGVCTDAVGNLYIGDWGNNRIRMIPSLTVNHNPYFTGGHFQYDTACYGLTSSDTLLKVIDIDYSQTEIWSLVSAPSHGTALAGYSTVSTSGLLRPSGLTYTPATGFSGNDTFTVSVFDGTSSDTTTICVTVIKPPVPVSAIHGADTVCVGHSIGLSDTSSGGSWNVINSNATILGGKVTGTFVGIDTVEYSVSNHCGTSTATHIVTVKSCPSNVSGVHQNDDLLTLYPNPNKGIFTLNLSSAFDEEGKLTVSNEVGEVVKEFSVNTNRRIELSLGLPAGVYFLNAVTAHGKWDKKMIVLPQ